MRSIAWIAEVLGAPIHHPDRSRHLSGVSIDTRSIRPGELFVALAGERTDGQRFVNDAFRKGAGGALVREVPSSPDDRLANCIRVADPLAALQSLAARCCAERAVPIIGVTGSAGKTTTKELIHAVLSRTYRTYRTPGNCNTEIGVPLALLNMPDDAEIGVVEMGLRHPGDIGTLCEIARPTLGVMTSIGDAHIGFFPDQEALAREKWALIDSLPQTGHAILNLDAPFVSAWRRDLVCTPISFGMEHPDADVRAVEIDDTRLDGLRLKVSLCGELFALRPPLLGRHNAYAVLAAVAVGHTMDVPLETTRRAIDTFTPIPHRLELKRSDRYGLILDDTYNASPAATRAALTALAHLDTQRRRVAVLGDMRELGNRSEAQRQHAALAEFINALGLDGVVTTGGLAERISTALQDRWGWAAERARHAADANELIGILSEHAEAADQELLTLIKGSRAMALDRLVDRLVHADHADHSDGGGAIVR